MKNTLLLSILLVSACATSGGNHPLHSTSNTVSRPEVHGHRGARWMRPENTLPAFEYAMDVGVDVLELDLGVTKDNILVVYHDQILNPVICRYKSGKEIKKQIPIRSLTLKQVKQFDCGSKKNPRFPEQVPTRGVEIPTLDELFSAVKKHKNGSQVRFNIEMKSEFQFPSYAPKPEEFAKLLLNALKKHQMLDRSIIQSFDIRTLKAAREIDANCKISVLIEDRPTTPLKGPIEDLAITLSRSPLRANILSPNHEWLTAEDVRAFHAVGMQVVPWTANSESDWKKLLEFGVDGIISDNPKALIDYLGKQFPNSVPGSRAQTLIQGTGGI